MFASDNNRNLYYASQYKILDSLYRQSMNSNKNFNNIEKLIFTRENMFLAFREIKNNKGRNTKGINDMTFRELIKLDVDKFYNEYVLTYKKEYRTMPTRSKKIPKSNGKYRTLEICNIEDRIIQQMIYNIIEPIAEGKMLNVSYGFRRERSAKDAINNVVRKSADNVWTVEVDFKNFFSEIPHNTIIYALKRIGIRDTKVLKMIKMILSSPMDGVVQTKGVPQGSILGPLLTNIVLHELDELLYYSYEDLRKVLGKDLTKKVSLDSLRHDVNRRDSRWMGVRTGFVQKAKIVDKNGHTRNFNKYQLRKINLCRGYLTRYADDVVVSCRTYKDALKMKSKIENFCRRRGIIINESGTRVFDSRKQRIEFLDYSIKNNSDCKVTLKIKPEKWKEIKNEVRYKTKLVKDGRLSIYEYNIFTKGISEYFDYVTDFYNSMHYLDGIQFRTLRNKTGKEGWVRGTMSIKSGNHYYGVHSKHLTKILFGKTLGNETRWLLPFTNKDNSREDFKYKSPNKDRIMYKMSEKITEKTLYISMETDWYKYESTCKRKSIYMSMFYGALYVQQMGRDPISQEYFYGKDTEVHHKLPLSMGGEDCFDNLIILTEETHRLLHQSILLNREEFKQRFPKGNYKKYTEYKKNVN